MALETYMTQTKRNIIYFFLNEEKYNPNVQTAKYHDLTIAIAYAGADKWELSDLTLEQQQYLRGVIGFYQGEMGMVTAEISKNERKATNHVPKKGLKTS